MLNYPIVGSVGKVVPAFSMFDSSFKNGPAAVNTLLTINGQTKSPTLLYLGEDADLSTWTAVNGPDLNIDGSGDLPEVDLPGPFINGNKAVRFNAGQYYRGEDNTGQMGTDDIVMEFVFLYRDISAILISKADTASRGFTVSHSTLQRLSIFIRDFSSNTGNCLTAASGLIEDNWYHVILFYDRSGSGQIYVNGVASGSASSMSSVGSIDISVPWAIGARQDDAVPSNKEMVAYMSMWLGNNWLDTHLQVDVAKERFLKMCGIFPQIAHGDPIASVFTRNSTAYIEIDTGTQINLAPVALNWPRVVTRKDENGDLITGYLSERQTDNKISDSEDFSGASWSPAACSILSSTQLAPAVEKNMQIFHEDGTAAAAHFLTQSGITTTNGVNHTFSIFVKAINRDWFRVQISRGGTGGNVFYDFDAANGVFGSTHSGSNYLNREIFDYGNGIYRIDITFLCETTSATVFLNILEGDGDSTFDGLDQDSLYIWGAMMEANSYSTSYRKSGFRNQDQLTFVGNDGNIMFDSATDKTGTFQCNVLPAKGDYDASGYIADLNDGGSTNERISLVLDETNDDFQVQVREGGSGPDTESATELSDGNIHEVKATWSRSSVTSSVDSGTKDSQTPTDIPVNLDRIDIGSDSSGANHIDGVISNIAIYRDQL